MTALRVTPLANEEGVDVEGVEEVEGVTILVHDCFGQSWASLCLMVLASMAHIREKCVDLG